MGWTDLITAGVAVSGAIIAILGAIFTWSNNRRAQYERVLAETAKLTAGPTAKSRHVVGPIFQDRPEGVVPLSYRQAAAFFDVLWAFERLYALFVSLNPLIRRGRLTRPQVLLLLTSRGAIKTWINYSKRVDRSIREHASSDGLIRLNSSLEQLEQLPASRRSQM